MSFKFLCTTSFHTVTIIFISRLFPRQPHAQPLSSSQWFFGSSTHHIWPHSNSKSLEPMRSTFSFLQVQKGLCDLKDFGLDWKTLRESCILGEKLTQKQCRRQRAGRPVCFLVRVTWCCVDRNGSGLFSEGSLYKGVAVFPSESHVDLV